MTTAQLRCGTTFSQMGLTAGSISSPTPIPAATWIGTSYSRPALLQRLTRIALGELRLHYHALLRKLRQLRAIADDRLLEAQILKFRFAPHASIARSVTKAGWQIAQKR